MSKEIFHLQVQDANQETELQITDNTTFEVDSTITSKLTGNELYFGWLPKRDSLKCAKFSVFGNGSQREWDGYLLAFSHKVPTATPVALVSREQKPRLGIITDRVHGPSIEAAPTEAQLHQVGIELRKLHAISVPGYGYFAKAVPQFRSAQEYLSFWFEKTLPYIEKKPSVYALFKQLHDAASVRIYSFSPSFIHKDVRLENVLVDAGGIKFIDFEWWQGGDSMDDIAIALYHWVRTEKRPDSFKPIVDAYFKGSAVTDQERITISFYLLFQALRFVSFCERINPAHKAEAYQYLDKIIEYIDSEHLNAL